MFSGYSEPSLDSKIIIVHGDSNYVNTLAKIYGKTLFSDNGETVTFQDRECSEYHILQPFTLRKLSESMKIKDIKFDSDRITNMIVLRSINKLVKMDDSFIGYVVNCYKQYKNPDYVELNEENMNDLVELTYRPDNTTVVIITDCGSSITENVKNYIRNRISRTIPENFVFFAGENNTNKIYLEAIYASGVKLDKKIRIDYDI